ncbi:MAG: MBL fold metallo-hydrolase [Pseudomonadales bacterium]|nr:MBL fold metallo-hydrolase [Pseudomonadales bacterium]
MIFRQLFHADSGTYTYLLGCAQSREAILIDPVVDHISQYLQLLRELDLKLTVALDTHVHADHITALGELREVTGCRSLMGEPARAACVSGSFRDGDKITIGLLSLEALHTPGHTDDSYCFLLQTADEPWLFTGDTLLIRGTGRTDFQNGDAHAQYRSLFEKILTLPPQTRVYPGHDYKGWTMSTLEEEKNHNLRLQIKNEAAYVEMMANLNLPNPKWMDVAVPANLHCGKKDKA